MEIIVGKTSGFCNGVRNAVEKANYVLEESNEPVYCLGELVHNEVVTKELENKGIIFIENIEETKGKTIIRAHGISKEIYEKAYKNEINLIDLTCPYVLNIHKIVEEYRNKGYYIILVGEKKHPEIIGTYSFCGENSIVISNENEVQSAIEIFEKTNINKLLIIVQTTYSIKGFDKIVKSIKSKIKNNVELKVKNTICSATENRQKELEQMSKEVDCMIIVGGKKSSNTNKLYEISCKNCKRTIFVESAEQIDTNIIDKNFKIGIMAGASTPQKSVENIINKLKEEVYV